MTNKKNDINFLVIETLINLEQSFNNDSDLMFYCEEELIFFTQTNAEFSDYYNFLSNEIFMSDANHYE